MRAEDAERPRLASKVGPHQAAHLRDRAAGSSVAFLFSVDGVSSSS